MLPALYALNLFFVGVVNPKYFQYSLIRIPIIIDADVTIEGSVMKTTTYHVTGTNCYLKTVDPLGRGMRISMVFACSEFLSPPVDGIVIWDSRDDQKQLSGTLVRLTGRPLGYRLFLIKYYLYRITRGLFFNLRLPGFQGIRRLFVRPVSVMQKEWRFSVGHRLFEQGEEGKVFYLIRKGEVDIVKTLDTGESVRLTTLAEGDIFGEMAIVGNQPRLATAVCRTDCILAVAEADNLDALIESNPVFTQRLIKNFANRLHDSEQIMLKSMAGMDDVSKRREKALITICRVLLLAGAGPERLKNSDIDAISSRLDLDKNTTHDIIAALSEANDIPSLEKKINSILEKS
jgi:CRP/FNR family cyclic AMP-dependent transcriptional regulator